MKNATDIAKATTKGGFHVLWGLIASTVISSVGTIFIARLLGDNGYGLYTVALAAPTFIAVFRDWGVNTAMVRCTAQFRTENRADEIKSIFISGLIFEIALGLTLSALSFAFSDVIAAAYNRPYIAPLIQIASFSILAGGLVNAASAAFTGMETMKLNSVMLIAQSTLKTLLIIGLVVLGLGTPGAVIGYTVSFGFAGFVGLLLLWTIYRKLPKPAAAASLQIKAYLTTVLRYGIPLSFSAILTAALGQFYTFLLPIHYVSDDAIIGNYGISVTFVVLIAFFATPITTMLFPAFSKLSGEKDKETLKNFFQYSVKYASLLVVPVAALVMCLSEPAVSTLFGSSYNSAPLFLSLLSIQYLFTAAGSLSIGNLITSQGETKFILYLTIVSAAIGFPMGSALILTLGVLGLIITSLMAGIPSMILGLMFIRKHYGVTVGWGSSARILLSSAAAAIITYAAVSQLGFSSWIRLAIGVVLFISIVIPAILVTRAINRSDISTLRGLTGGFGPITKVTNLVLRILEKAMNALRL